jgi:hypothetical protein
MIIGAHSILYSVDPAADRAFLRDVLGLTHVDVGDGWLIFGLPPAEVAVHPSERNGPHELYLLCDDVSAFVTHMEKQGFACGPVLNRGWGLLTEVTLPGGGKLGVYQPRHARPKPMAARRPAGKGATRTARAVPGTSRRPKGTGARERRTRRRLRRQG